MNLNPEFLIYAAAFLVFIAIPLWTVWEMYKNCKKHGGSYIFVVMTSSVSGYVCYLELIRSMAIFDAIKHEHAYTLLSIAQNLFIPACLSAITVIGYIILCWIAFSKKAGEIIRKLP